MPKKIVILIAVLMMLSASLFFAQPAEAGVLAQAYFTPTPDADGRIMYVVQERDSCITIYLKTGVEVNNLILQNNLDESCTIIVGQKLLLATVEVPTVPAGPVPTETPAGPTPTPFFGSGQICIYLFNDENGNAKPEDGETQIAGGAVSISDRIGKISETRSTNNSANPVCFDELPEGEYNISVAPPQDYNPTTSMNFPIRIQAGDSSMLDFGAQVSSTSPIAGGSGTGPQRTSPLLAILGGLLVLGGAGLGVYVFLLRKSSAL